MTEERLQEIKDSIEFQYTLAKAKGHENALLFTDEEQELVEEIERLNSIIKEVREKVDNFDVFKEFTFPLMKRDEEQQVKSSIDYEWRKSVKKPILEILDKVEEK